MFSASTKSGKNPTGGAADPQFNYVTMLLHGDGTNGAQNNTFLDSSTNNFTITRNGNTTQGSFSPYGSNWSNFFGTSTQKLSTTGMTALGSDFTLEVWVYPTSFNDYNTIFDNRLADGDSAGLVLGLTSAAKVYFYTNAAFQITTTTALSLNTWTHIALVRSGSGSGNVKIYINGVADATTATYTTSFTSTAPSIGDDWVTRGFLQYFGYLSNLRAVTSALYTSTFTPSTTPLTAISGTVLLTCQSNRFIDNSSSALTMTATGTPSVQRFNPFGASAAYSTSVIGGSGYFDGVSGYLSTSVGAIGTQPFTLECWLYNTVQNNQPIFALGSYSTGIDVRFDQLAADVISCYIANSPYTLVSNPTPNQWAHFALTRDSSNNLRAFYNGVLSSTFTVSSNLTNTNLRIGNLVDGGVSGNARYTGYMSDFRYVIGTAVYTSSFTPPTAPLTAISGTSLLANFTNGAIYDNAMINNLETVGNAQISTSVKKYGTGSMYFDGSASYLKTADSVNFELGDASWTIEAWIYPTSTGVYPVIAAQYGAGSGNNSFFFSLGPNNTNLELYLYSTASNPSITATNAITLNTWQHVAAVRNGNTVTLYVNGISVGTPLTFGTSINSTYPLTIGWASSSQEYPFFGYIDDFRFTRGYARYTANFTPPTAAFPNTGPL